MPASISVGKRVVKTFNDEQFAKVRVFFGVEGDFAPGGSLETGFDFKQMAAGGGKGGQLMAFDDSRKFLIKEMNQTDHTKLLEIAESFVVHVTRASEDGSCKSLLCRFFAHFYDQETRRPYVVMNNWLPRYSSYASAWGNQFSTDEQELALEKLEENTSIMDLKGSADDKMLTEHGHGVHEVHKRIWNVGMWCGKCAWSNDRRLYYEGKKKARGFKFLVTAEQKDWVMARLRSDIAWLIEQGLMDYSLMTRQTTLPRSMTNMAVRTAVGNSARLPPGLIAACLLRTDGGVQAVRSQLAAARSPGT